MKNQKTRDPQELLQLRYSDRDGAVPADKPASPADITATLMHLLGMPNNLEITDRTGPDRPAAARLYRGA